MVSVQWPCTQTLVRTRRPQCPRRRRKTGQVASPVFLSIPFPLPCRVYADGSAWAASAGAPLHLANVDPPQPSRRRSWVPPRSFRPVRPTAFHDATKAKLGRPPPRFFSGLFSPSRLGCADARPGLRERCYTTAPTASPCRAPARDAVYYCLGMKWRCRRQGLNPFDYLKDLLTRLPSAKKTEIQQFIPTSCAKA